jgi:hypothetical protein
MLFPMSSGLATHCVDFLKYAWVKFNVAAYVIILLVVGVPLAALLLYGRRGPRVNSPTAPIAESARRGRLQVSP